MGHSNYDPAVQNCPPWNAGKMIGTKRPPTQKEIRAVRFFLDREARLRDRALLTSPPGETRARGSIDAACVREAVCEARQDDANDAEAICEAVMRFVPVKSPEQQAALALHRTRDLLVKQRAQLVNIIRGLLAEFVYPP